MIHILAQVFSGPGLEAGIEMAASNSGLPGGDPRGVVTNILSVILSFAALIAVIMVVIAGLYLLFSMGNDDGKDKAKKIILYTLIGLVVLLFARLIVELVTVLLAGEIS